MVRYYHANYERFADKDFQKATKDAGQTISYYGVNTHFQNGRAEKKTRDFQDEGRTTLLHAIARWSQVVTTHLWRYALEHECDVNN